MIGLTLGVAAFFGLLALILRPSTALGIVVMSMMVWPEFLRIPVGPAAMSAPRLVALALILRLLFMGRHKMVGLFWVDKLIIVMWIWNPVAAIIMGAETSHIYEMIGRGFDTVFMYFVARFTFTSASDVKGFFLPLSLTILFMAYAGAQEALTSNSLYQAFASYTTEVHTGEYRYGLLRARASTSISIYFGMAMMLLLGFSWSVRGYVNSGFTARFILFVAFIGTLSSMSSGPWLGCIILIIFNLYAGRPSLIKPSLRLVLIAAILLEVASNRHFYNLIDYVALNEATAWYRTRLMEVAFSNLDEFWLAGVGSDWPHHWGAQLDTRVTIDVVNHFLIVGLYGGLPAMYMYIATHVGAVRRGIRAWHDTNDPSRRKLIFGLAAAVLALDLSSMSVGLYGPPLLLSNILLGMLVSVSVAWKVEEEFVGPLRPAAIEPYESARP